MGERAEDSGEVEAEWEVVLLARHPNCLLRALCAFYYA